MSESNLKENEEVLDDLDAFFNSASNTDTGAISKAAISVLQPVSPKAAAGASRKPPDGNYDSAPHLDGKFVAVNPSGKLAPGPSGAPFVLIPAHIHTILPRWGWAAIFFSLLLLAAGIITMPIFNLRRLAARLEDGSQSQVHAAMHQLVLSGNRRTVDKLFTMASSDQAGMEARLRAIDTLCLIPAVYADQALLRLELSGTTHETVREAAGAARKQRVLSREWTLRQ
ncbi:MAG: hypothetical protein FWG74_08490 [Planctomycetes bacterium]|nr:hypothetical protein [Planctomycetota bacterium]